jgi:isocitrate dehydrogenase
LDNTPQLQIFATLLEQSVIETVERGFMTKDLALIVAGSNEVSRNKYCETIEFIKKVREFLTLNLNNPKL